MEVRGDVLEVKCEELDVEEEVLEGASEALEGGELPCHEEVDVEVVVSPQQLVDLVRGVAFGRCPERLDLFGFLRGGRGTSWWVLCRNFQSLMAGFCCCPV